MIKYTAFILTIFVSINACCQNIISYKDSTVLDTVKTTVIEKDTIWREQWLYVSLPHDTSYPITSVKYGSHVVKIPVYGPAVTTLTATLAQQSIAGTADLPVDNTTTTPLNSWFEFSQTLNFQKIGNFF